MLNFLDQYKLIKGQAVIGIELIFNTKNSYTLIVLELVVNKDTIEVSKRWVDPTIEQIANENTKKLPIYLSISGKGIIHKKIKVDEYTKEQELLNQVLPNASVNDFYLQTSILSVNEKWVSIVRKDVLNNLIEEFKRPNLFVVQLYLGPFILDNCIPLIDQSVLKTTTHELLIENNNIIQLDSLGSVSGGDEYQIEGETINSHELIAFGTALSHFVLTNKLEPITIKKIVESKEEYLNKNKFVVVGFSMLILFFLITIVNMMVSNSYQEANNDLQYQVNSKKEYVEELSQLKTALETKEQFVQNSGVTQASKISYYVDQIALTVPKSVQLNQLFINPLRKRINKAEDIFFIYNKVKILGTVTKSIELNSWVKTLKKYDWVGHIEIMSFNQDNLRTAGAFEIEIDIKH